MNTTVFSLFAIPLNVVATLVAKEQLPRCFNVDSTGLPSLKMLMLSVKLVQNVRKLALYLDEI
jgi:hypothetical protein